MRKTLSIILTVIAVLLVFTACNPSQSFSDELVSVSLAGSQSKNRSLIAENDFDIANVKVWKYTAEKADKGLATGASDTEIALEKDSAGNWMTQALSQGAWNFELFGYSDDAGTVLICSGTAENQTITVANHNVKITVKPSQTASGTIVIKDDIKVAAKSGKVYDGTQYTKTVKVYNSSDADVTAQIASVPSGRYKVEVIFSDTVNGEIYTAAKAVKYINVYDNLTTTVSGTVTETEQAADITAEGGTISASSEPKTVAVAEGKNSADVTIDVASTPAGTTEEKKTSVKFPANSVSMGSSSSLTLTVESSNASAASNSYAVESSEGVAVASFDFTLTGADSTDFNGDEGVEITTYIATGLENEPVIKYVGDSTGKAPELVSYDSSTGKLVFKVYHFSTYLVLSQNTVAVDKEGNIYTSLEDAASKVASGDTITLLKDIDLTGYSKGTGHEIAFSKNVTLDMDGKTITSNNYGVYYVGDGLTIKNGTFKSLDTVEKSHNGIGSYAIFFGENTETVNETVKNYTATVENVICEGGINVCSHNLVVKNSKVDGTHFYALWAEISAQITVESGTFTGGSVYVLSTGADKSGNNNAEIIVEGGSFKKGKASNFYGNKVGFIKIKGGDFEADPSNYLETGYTTSQDSTTKIWTVSKQVEES